MICSLRSGSPALRTRRRSILRSPCQAALVRLTPSYLASREAYLVYIPHQRSQSRFCPPYYGRDCGQSQEGVLNIKKQKAKINAKIQNLS